MVIKWSITIINNTYLTNYIFAQILYAVYAARMLTNMIIKDINGFQPNITYAALKCIRFFINSNTKVDVTHFIKDASLPVA